MNFEIEKIWQELESECYKDSTSQRIYRRIDAVKETGLRISLKLPDKKREILIGVGKSDEDLDIDSPKWRGMQLKKITLNVPSNNSIHISISLKNPDLCDVFTAVCKDLCESLCECSSAAERREELSMFLDRWSRFFRTQKAEGLSQSLQQGLFGEIWWLERMLQNGIESINAVKSWKGCQRNYHDFELCGYIVEVKSTKSKEPLKVWINNERQLDNDGVAGLFLFILSLHILEKESLTLPSLIARLRLTLNDNKTALQIFERNLISAGYLDVHADSYVDGYLVRSQKLFKVHENFPRITKLPHGTGDLKYSLVVSACTKFQVPEEYFFNLIKQEFNNG